MPEITTQERTPQYNSINDSREVTVEIVTPVHVGTTSEKLMRRGTDYFYMNNTLYFVELSTLLKAAAKKGVRMDTVSNLLAENRVNDLQTYLFQTLKIDIEEVSYSIIDNRFNPGNEIRPLIRTGLGHPYIPGSSIKGALRSVLFNYLNDIIDNKTITEWVFDREANRKVEKTRDVRDTELENFLLGKFDQSIMRYIRVHDAPFVIKNTDVYKIDLFNLYNNRNTWDSNWKENFDIVAECFMPKTTSTFRLDFATPLATIIHEKYKKGDLLPVNLKTALTKNPFDQVRQLINNYTRTHLEREIDFFETYNNAQDTDLIIENLKNLLKYTEGSTSCLLRMSYGSGFHGITGDWRFKDHTSTIAQGDNKNMVYDRNTRQREPARYKSRRIAGTELMGFVKMSF
jgi:CRISPR type III-A-associated RAMP protein Csm5